MDRTVEDDEKSASATFMASSLTTTPDEMASLVGLTPTRSHKIGDPVSSTAAEPRRKNHLYGVHSTMPGSAPLDEHIVELLDRLEPVASALADLSKSADLYLFCGFSSGNAQGGFTLSPGTLRRIADLNLELSLDLYPPSDVPPS
jgi:hypothetical protein